MPPRPINSRISSCGNVAATRSIDGISEVAVAGSPESVALAAPIRTHLGQRPCGAPAGIGAPHFGQCFTSTVSLITPLPETCRGQGYDDFSGKAPDFGMSI